MAEMKAKTRSMIEAGFASAKLGQFDQAQRQLTQAMTQLLQEHPVDGALVKSLAERMTSPTLYIELMSNQWLEWGEIAKAKNSPEAAILLLKKGLSREKDKNFARRALYVLGETCITNKIEIEDGVKRLQKVIEMNGNDMIAKQAQKILDSIGK
jgi:tetratricopeptide (TPR) repeat protein